MNVGAIVDVYPEASEAFRGCVLDYSGKTDNCYVVNCSDGEKGWFCATSECSDEIVNINDLGLNPA